jgi:hypothetical protein
VVSARLVGFEDVFCLGRPAEGAAGRTVDQVPPRDAARGLERGERGVGVGAAAAREGALEVLVRRAARGGGGGGGLGGGGGGPLGGGGGRRLGGGGPLGGGGGRRLGGGGGGRRA